MAEISSDGLEVEQTGLGPEAPAGLSLELLLELHWWKVIGSARTKYASPVLHQGYAIALAHPSSKEWLVRFIWGRGLEQEYRSGGLSEMVKSSHGEDPIKNGFGRIQGNFFFHCTTREY